MALRNHLHHTVTARLSRTAIPALERNRDKPANAAATWYGIWFRTAGHRPIRRGSVRRNGGGGSGAHVSVARCALAIDPQIPLQPMMGTPMKPGAWCITRKSRAQIAQGLYAPRSPLQSASLPPPPPSLPTPHRAAPAGCVACTQSPPHTAAGLRVRRRAPTRQSMGACRAGHPRRGARASDPTAAYTRYATCPAQQEAHAASPTAGQPPTQCQSYSSQPVHTHTLRT